MQLFNKQVKTSTIFYSLVIVSILAWVLSDAIYRNRIRSNSKFVYTIAQITDYYHKGGVNGKEIRFSHNGTSYTNHCNGEPCRRSKVGEKYYIKFYLDDPDVFDIIFRKGPILIDVVVPPEGWTRLPD